MNLKTTIVLLTLIILGSAAWLLVALLSPGTVSSDTLAVLERELRPESVTRIEIVHGDRRIVLDKGADGWSLPGKWPVRKPEAEQLVGLLTSLHTRFAPIPVADKAELAQLGLDRADSVQVTVQAGGTDYKLTFGEEPGQGSRFSRPTYLRLGESSEALRVAPGLMAALDRPQEYYMQRRLFPVERVAKEGGERGEKVEQLAAEAIAVKGGDHSYTLARAGNSWELREPVRDRVDPEKIKSILTGLPDIWVERFVDAGKKSADDFGLKDPAQVLSVTRPKGDTVTLQIGKTSDKRSRIVQKPGGSPFMPKPSIDVIEEEFKYAKLKDNDQIFEIKGDKLKDIAVAADAFRDPQLARFKTDDVKKLTIDEGGRTLVFVKRDDGWKLENPAFEAERGRVDDILDKLSGLRAGDKDIIDKADLKTYGLDKPAAIKIDVEEGKDKKTKEFTFLLGKQEGDKGKLYVQVAERVGKEVTRWDRVNAVEGDLLKLAQRPALAYRNRRVLNFASSDAARVDVHRQGQTYALEQSAGNWRLAAPVQADLDSSKSASLPRELGTLEAVDFITADPKKDDLDQLYQLAKPAATIKITFSDKKRPAQTIEIGKKREGKDEYYARLGSDPAIFTIKKDVFETLNKDSLSYRPVELWTLEPDDLAELRFRKGEEKYVLERDGAGWKLTDPFTATVAADQVRPLADELAKLKAEKYVAHSTTNLAEYGLDKPYLRIAVREGVKKEKEKEKGQDKEKEKDKKERVLLVGKQTAKDAKTRYARLGDSEAIFVLGDKAVATVDRGPLDLLDRKLLALDIDAIKSIRTTAGKETFTLAKDKDGWRVERGAGPPFTADKEAAEDALQAWSLVRAQKLAAYGDKVDLARFGLDKPAAVVIVTVHEKADKDKPGKTVEHKLLLGSEVKDTKGDRYVRVDGSPAIAILDAAALADLRHTPLDFVNRTLLKLEPAKVTGLTRRMGSDVLQLVKKDGWRIVKPASLLADDATVQALANDLARLRANKVAAYPAKDLKPFGLDVSAPTVTVLVEIEKGKTADHVLFLGKLVDDKSGTDRYARLDKSETVVVLPGRLAEQLVAPALQFRDRLLAKVPSAGKLVLERGIRKAAFAKVDGDWNMTQPVVADAEQSELENFIKSFAEFRADKLVAEKPADLKPYGLDRPLVQWKLFSQDKDAKEALTLLIGGKEKDGPRVYAKLTNSDLVVLLDNKLSGQALAEYRSRKVWPALDSFQVEKLAFGYDKGAFTLQKMGSDWQLAGKPDVKIKSDAVRDTLDALARLKAERWVVDKDADPKLFGLEPPLLSLEVDTGSGKRTLKVGRQEGASNRYYALVPGENSGAVFLIGAADAQAIVRPLAAFLAGKS